MVVEVWDKSLSAADDKVSLCSFVYVYFFVICQRCVSFCCQMTDLLNVIQIVNLGTCFSSV